MALSLFARSRSRRLNRHRCIRSFSKDRETATQIMLKVHRDGKGMCGVYPKDIASTKVELVLTHARKAGHPLQCVMEEA